jgi:hypothetical protein
LTSDHQASLEEQIYQWRNYLRRRQEIHAVNVAELKDHLREQVSVLTDTGLATLGVLDAPLRAEAKSKSQAE